MNLFLLKLSENHPEVQQMLNPPQDSCDKIYNFVANFIDKIVRYGLLFFIVFLFGICILAWKIRSKGHLER
jgi:type II secretory pathway component PulF